MSGFADGVDQVLEFAIAPSFTRIGYDVRSRVEHWTPLSSYRLEGRVVVITGATSGLGLAAARRLMGDGATVEIVARNAKKADAVCRELRAGSRGSVDYTVADTSDLGSIRAAAVALCERHDVVDVLIHNAGALDTAYATSPEGIERTVASQVVGPFLLTALLLDRLRASSHGRIIWVASGGLYSQPLDVERLEMGPADYDGTAAYARAKRAQVTLAEMMGERLGPEGIVVHAMHPGWADTPGVQRSLPTFRRLTAPLLRSGDQGADTIVWLAADDGAPLATTGGFWLDRRRRALHRLGSTRRSDTPAQREALWAWCVQRSGADLA